MSAGRLVLTGAALAAALLLSACGGTNDAQSPAASMPSEASDGSLRLASVFMADGWAKAADTGSMTGLFGTLHNDSDRDLTISSVETSASESAELHEVTTDGRMQRIEGDVVIPAGQSFELAPGANHIMLMGLTKPLLAGDDVRITIVFSDGAGIDVTVPVKDYAGANESYDEAAGGHSADAGDGGH
ncbi:copper chaperone PCu(A)C [Leucobacter sp. gxy201]|uniref:copper chaperone PCu(A)C n=1 Tax=Leucobacter sp. gxy201 TaxID=2957200 RepID=UPI003D9FC6F7